MLGKKIKDARRRLNMSQAQLAESAGVVQQLISQLENDKNTTTKHLPTIARILGMRPGDLDPAYAVDGVSEESPVRIADQSPDMIPVYNVQASAGHGAIVGEEEVVDLLSFPQGYLRTITKANPRDLAIISVKGESMSPTLADNDVVMVDTSKRDLSFEGLFVLRDGGASLLVKRITRGSRRGTVLLISDNRAYPPVERAAEDIEVVGKVVWMGVKV